MIHSTPAETNIYKLNNRYDASTPAGVEQNHKMGSITLTPMEFNSPGAVILLMIVQYFCRELTT